MKDMFRNAHELAVAFTTTMHPRKAAATQLLAKPVNEIRQHLQAGGVPKALVELLNNRDAYLRALKPDFQKICHQIVSDYNVINEAAAKPHLFIGRTVKKKSGKPFTGGESTVIVTGIVKHPNRTGYACTFDYNEVVPDMNHPDGSYTTSTQGICETGHLLIIIEEMNETY